VNLDWTLIVQYAISGAIVSWPVFIAGLWIGHRKSRRHIETVADRQTHAVRKITDDQTGILLHRLSWPYQQGGARQEEAGDQDRRPAEEPGHRPEDH